nr:radical SAM/SPASM family putative metalloenzyme maturase [Fundidesulfovibrio terrae]
MFVEVTSRCNLLCPMCVKHSGAGSVSEGDMSSEIFGALAPAFPHLRALILNGIGEPLMHPRLAEFIRCAKKSMPSEGWIGFQTNGHLLDEVRGITLIEAGLDRIFLSVDSATPDLFKSVRGGGNLSHVERALRALSGAQAQRPESRLEIGAEFVLMRDNFRELPDTAAWLAERGVTRLVVSHILPYGDIMADQPLFGVNTETSVRFFEKWAARARQEGIDLSRYLKILWKYKKSPEERRIVEFVNTMATLAVREDIPFHVGNLMSGDDLDQAEEVFRKAETVARERGLSLVLPPLRPLNGRACHAVEQGGAFVTWDGRVSPCHFLWRGFNCYFYGRKKQVFPRFFGELHQMPLLEIWNSPAYKEFRASVLRRGYPHCPGCNVYPCSEVETTDFEFDCYGETIPCGDCPWSMGLLQCMGQENEDYSR